jgi:glycosyltransferase involved in cell wall biosynthesis
MIANSRSVEADVREALDATAPVETVYNAVDLDRFHPAGAAADLDRLSGLPPAPAGTVRVGLVATFGRWKGHDTFLDALARIDRSRLRAYIVGGALYETIGSQYSIEELRAAAAAAGLGTEVGFTGFVEDPAPIMRALDIVVHASTHPEPFGLVIAEAMACARAVIVSGSGGATELVDDGVEAVTFPSGDAAALAAAIARLASDAPLRQRLGGAAREAAVTRFGRSTFGDRMMQIYERVGADRTVVA